MQQSEQAEKHKLEEQMLHSMMGMQGLEKNLEQRKLERSVE